MKLDNIYPCRHFILRLLINKIVNTESVISLLYKLECDILEDKICNQTTNMTMVEFWENSFQEKQDMWGIHPAHSASVAKDFFVEKSVKSVLIPGIGYGRNSKVFQDSGMSVTGIEISKTAIDLAKKNSGTDTIIYHGSVTDMPFDAHLYDGVFCHALIHLLDKHERENFISDCFVQLNEKGFMIFTVVSKKASIYGKGIYIGKDRFEMFGGARMFFYDRVAIREEFNKYGLFEITEISENYPFF